MNRTAPGTREAHKKTISHARAPGTHKAAKACQAGKPLRTAQGPDTGVTGPPAGADGRIWAHSSCAGAHAAAAGWGRAARAAGRRASRSWDGGPAWADAAAADAAVAAASRGSGEGEE
eukprot:453896-Hanusia_phi.AAC.1